MKGCITKHKLKSGRFSWGYVYTAGHDANGKRIQTVRKGFATMKQADEALRIALGPNGEDAKVDREGQTFGAFFKGWLEQHGAKEWGLMTREQNDKRAAYAIRKFGQVALQKLSAMQLEQDFGALLKSGGRNGRPLSRKTVRSIEALVAQSLKTAKKWKLLPAGNPMDEVDRTAANKLEIQIPQADQYEKLLDVVQGTRYYPFCVLAAASGCRRGELLALKWSDVDLKTGMVAVSKSVSETKAGLEIKCTKSRKSRFVRVSRTTLQVLLEHRKTIEHERALFGDDYKSNDLVFPTPDGSYYSPDRVTNRISEFMQKAGIDASLHSLRHLHASMMLSKHVPIPIVSKRLGHANSQVTLDIYAHAMKNDEATAAELWDEAVGDIVERTQKPRRNGPLSFVIPKPGAPAVNE